MPTRRRARTFRPPPKVKQRAVAREATASVRNLFRRLWPHVSRRRRVQFAMLFLLMVLASLAEVLSIGAVLPFLGVLTAPERIFNEPAAAPFIRLLGLTEPHQLLVPLTVVFAVAAIFSGAMRLALLWVQMRLGYSIGADLSISIYRRTLYQPYATHVARNSSEIVSGVSAKATQVVNTVIMPSLQFVGGTLMIFAILMVIVAVDPVVALTAFAGFGGIYALVIRSTRARLKLDSARISVEQNQVIKALQEGLGGIRDVLIDGTQATYCRIFRKADLPLRRAQANVQIIAGTPKFGIEALGMVLIAVLALVLASRPEGMLTAVPVLGALALGAQRMLPLFQQAYGSWTTVRGGDAVLEDAIELLEQPLPDDWDAEPPAPLAFRDALRLEGVSFRYTPDGPWVIRDLDLEIVRGSRLGIMGLTGSGKSTLLDVLMGLLPLTEGSFTVDGVPVREGNRRAWQVHLAHVPQAIFLADTTIEENIALGVLPDQIDRARVREAAQKAQIAGTIESWKHGFQTRVGERGVRLSGGQRQRIGIARALYKRADVLVLDEATSALDNETERTVMEFVQEAHPDLTIIIVAHRLTTLLTCKRVIELEGGVIKRSGTYEDVVAVAPEESTLSPLSSVSQDDQ